MQETLQELVSGGVYLVNIHLNVQPPDAAESFNRISRDLGIFQPLDWRRTTSRQGQSMLMLSDIYDVLSLSLLSIKVESLDVTLNVTSQGCWERMTSRELLDKLQSLLLDDFQVKDQTSSSTHTKDLNICNQELRRVQNRAAQFVHVCCHRTHDDGKVVCSDVTSDPWLEVLFAAVLIIKVLVVLYSPSFLPESVYHHQTSYMQYVYHEEVRLFCQYSTSSSYFFYNSVVVIETSSSKVEILEKMNFSCDFSILLIPTVYLQSPLLKTGVYFRL